MSKSVKVNDWLEVLSADDDLSKRIAAALERRIAKEFLEERPKQGKKSKKGGTK